MIPRLGTLDLVPALDRPDLLAAPVAAALDALGPAAGDAWVCAIDPALADTAAFSEAYEVPLEVSANCVVVLGRRAGEERAAACVVRADTRADVNATIRRRLDVRKLSFAPMEWATETTGMEYGGITPVGVPATWPVLVDEHAAALERAVIGSGIRGSKLVVPGTLLAALPSAEVGPYAR
ncbi:YbaK/EbsC family protein [Mumia quercus]|uniref:YbaK/EbsC family protein n=1 Tax=Mumia quercus TaxID=2976125 RepID=UPI0021D3DF8C|nr:YbaK/EbsC family protein [Mumia quercus]